MKSVRIWSYSGLHFLVFGITLNTDTYVVLKGKIDFYPGKTGQVSICEEYSFQL